MVVTSLPGLHCQLQAEAKRTRQLLPGIRDWRVWGPVPPADVPEAFVKLFPDNCEAENPQASVFVNASVIGSLGLGYRLEARDVLSAAFCWAPFASQMQKEAGFIHS